MRATKISIRTPAWGVTCLNVFNLFIFSYFNSHPRVGGDTISLSELMTLIISIRTPAWGVTGWTGKTIFGLQFQFAPPRGG